ncbi:MAG: M28 family peptidase, partial [Candidatus Krumholzibacteriia bacterium]
MNRIKGTGIILSAAAAILWAALHSLESNASAAALQSGLTIVDKVEGFRLERLVRALSGADSIFSGADKTRIGTRYALSTGMDVVRRYLTDEVREAGYEPTLQRFMVNIEVPDLTGSAFSANADTFWAADAAGKIYLTIPAMGGLPKFTRVGDLAQNVYDLERDPRGRLWASCRITGSAYGGLFVSTDGGASWSIRASGTNIFTLGTVAFSSEQLGMAAGSNGTVIRTANFGESWSPLDPATFGYEAFNGIAASGPMHYWLVTDSGYLYETSDFGTTWSRRSLMFGRLSGIDFYGDRAGVAVGYGKAFYTKDAGATWTSVSVATEFTAVRMGDSLKVVASGTGGEIWTSEDGGVTWGRFGTECSVARDVWSIASAGDGSYWLAGRDLVRHVSWNSALKDCAAIQFADTVWGENIAFIREGEKEPDRRFLLTAHYDSKSGSPYDCAPGADDNASGVAAVLECARILREERLDRSVEFVLFDGEELGLLGSRFYAAALDSGIVYEGVLNLDMIGWTPNAEAMSAVIAKRAGATPDTILADAMEAAIDSFVLPLATSFLLP